MSNALKSFIGGLAGGYIDETRRKEDLGRQGKIDAMREQEFNLRQRQLEGQLTDQETERSSKAEILAADADLPEVRGGTALQVGGALSANTDPESAANSLQAIEQANAGLAPGDQIPTGSAVPTQTVGVKTFLESNGGLAAAEAYRNEGNSEEGRVKRKAETIRRLRGTEAAQEFLASHTANQEALRAARVQTVQRIGLEKIANGDFNGFADLYNKYDDGNTAVYEPGNDGVGSFAIYKGDPKDNQRIDTIGFKDKDELSQLFIDRMDPVGAINRRAASEKENSKLTPVAKGAAMVDRNGREVYRNSADGDVNIGTDENPVWQSGGGKSGKAPKPTIELTRDILKDAMAKNEADPKTYARTYALADHLFATDPTLAPGVAANIATTAAADEVSPEPKFVSMQVNLADGTVNKVYSNPDHEGGKQFNIGRNAVNIADYAKQMGPEKMQEVGAGVLATMAPAKQQVFLQAARDPAQLAVLLKAVETQAMAANRPDLIKVNQDAIRNQVQILTMYQDVAPAKESAPARQAAPKLSGATGLYQPTAAVPTEFAQRAKQADEKRIQLAAEQVANTKAAIDAKAAKAQEISWLTEAEARVMKPSEAADYYRKYQDVLPPNVLRVLRLKQ